MLNIFTKCQALFHKLENFLLFILVLGMLSFSITQIFLRNFFEFGIVWAESLTRLMVLWTTLIGSMVATRSLSHIRIDLVERYTSGQVKVYIPVTINFLTAILCLALVYYSFQFLLIEYEDGTRAFTYLPNWIFISILPLSFLVMGLRYLFQVGAQFTESYSK